MKNLLTILKDDHNFREISYQNHYYKDWQEVTFSHLSYDSRQINPNTLFFAKGAAFKVAFLEDAISQGLKWYVSETDYQLSIPAIIVSDVKRAMSLIAMAFYQYPQKHLKLLAFTGTKGKTTAAYFAYHILKEDYRPSLLSTLESTLDGKTFFKSKLTTPESLDLFSMMAVAVKQKMTHFIMEVSSQAYLVNRIYGLHFDVGVFLNISPDHIGPLEHPNFDDYFFHKRQLLANSRAMVINHDMKEADFLINSLGNKPYDLYGKNTANAIYQRKANTFLVTGRLADSYTIQLLGDFNQDNALAAALACQRLGCSQEAIKAGIAKTRVAGRMETLTRKNGAKVFVDYAHNGESLDKLIQVVTSYQTGQITLIIGATGNKGESRRADFAQVINRYPRLNVILTADDPNYEDPNQIAQEIASGIHRDVTIIADRKQAIALGMSKLHNAGDALIIAGKGTDAFQIVHGKKEPYKGDLALAKDYL